ncbi:MAG: YlbF family regulator [Defluviitaleaceae bacterium]|nr:YlbF family regulator [Defluviitaleaceae bacterium]
MTIFEEKAKELADDILRSELSKDFADAQAAAEANPDDEAAMAEFLQLRTEYYNLINSVLATIKSVLGDVPKKSCCGGGCCRKGGEQ